MIKQIEKNINPQPLSVLKDSQKSVKKNKPPLTIAETLENTKDNLKKIESDLDNDYPKKK